MCGKHGAGFLAREKSGERKSVRSNLRDGSRARPDTLEAIRDEQPRLRALIDHFANEEIDLVPLYRYFLAITRALAQYHLEKADLNDPRQIEKSMALHCKAVELLSKVVTLENRYGPVSPGEIEKLIDGVVLTMRTYVPEDLQSEARLFLRQLIEPEDPDVGVPRRE